MRLLDVLGVERVTAAGHGIGARVVLEMCATDSRRVGRLALVNPAADLSSRGVQSAVLRMTNPLLGAMPSRLFLATLRRRVARLYASAGAHGSALDHYLRPFRGPQGAATLLAHVRALTLTEQARADSGRPRFTPASRRPTAIVYGRSDALVSPSAGQQLRTQLPESSVFEVAGGHFSPEESPEQVAAALGVLLTTPLADHQRNHDAERDDARNGHDEQGGPT
jgi:pimeloyl-ACP methyl ester carboxylesterase